MKHGKYISGSITFFVRIFFVIGVFFSLSYVFIINFLIRFTDETGEFFNW